MPAPLYTAATSMYPVMWSSLQEINHPVSPRHVKTTVHPLVAPIAPEGHHPVPHIHGAMHDLGAEDDED